MNILRGVLMILGAWTAISFLFVVACCVPRAVDNARVRAARRRSSAEALELAQMRREFDAIVGTTWRADR